jgi:hypothetical protein
MNVFNFFIKPFKMCYYFEKSLLFVSPLTFLILNVVGIYWSIGVLIYNKPIFELITLGLIKEKKQ